MAIIEDNGLNETLEIDVEITVDLKEGYYYSNIMVIFPVNVETNLVEIPYLAYKNFDYKNINKNIPETENTIFIRVLFIFIGIFILIAIIAFIAFIRNRRNKKKIKADNDEKLMSSMSSNENSRVS